MGLAAACGEPDEELSDPPTEAHHDTATGDCDDGDLCTADHYDAATDSCAHVLDGACVGSCRASTAIDLAELAPGAAGHIVGRAELGDPHGDWSCTDTAHQPTACTRSAALLLSDATAAGEVLGANGSADPACVLTCSEVPHASCEPLHDGVTYVVDAVTESQTSGATWGRLRLRGFCLATTNDALAGDYLATFDDATGHTASQSWTLAARHDALEASPTNVLTADEGSAKGAFSALGANATLTLQAGDGYVDARFVAPDGTGDVLAFGRLYARGNTLSGHVAAGGASSTIPATGFTLTLERQAEPRTVAVAMCLH